MFTTTLHINRRTLAVLAAVAISATGAAASADSAEARAKAPRCAIGPKQDAEPTHRDVTLPNGAKMRMVDFNGDGKWDTFLFDWNDDGVWDAGAVDCDRDGKFDYRWTDKNGDGEPEPGELTPLRGPRADDTCVVAKRAYKSSRCRKHPHRILGLRRRPNLRFVGSTQPAPQLPAPQQQQADPQPQSTPAPPAPTGMTADVNGDGTPDAVSTDGGRTSNTSYFADGAQSDEVVVGTKDGGKVHGKANVDNDPRDEEIILEEPNLSPNESHGMDLDGDGDHDVIVIGTEGGAKVVETGNADNDPSDVEIFVEDPNRSSNESYGIDTDGDGDHDVMVFGTGS
jgi:hypothetical protein